MKIKPHLHKPKTIKEAIDNCQQFLECDLYARFRPEQCFPTKKKEMWYRDSNDVFKNERDFEKYLKVHFKILKKEINDVINDITKKKK